MFNQMEFLRNKNSCKIWGPRSHTIKIRKEYEGNFYKFFSHKNQPDLPRKGDKLLPANMIIRQLSRNSSLPNITEIYLAFSQF